MYSFAAHGAAERYEQPRNYNRYSTPLHCVTLHCYRPQTKLRKGNVFTSMCQEFCPQGGRCLTDTPQADTPPPGRHPSPRQTPLPQADTPPPGRHPQADTPQADTPCRQTPPRQTPPAGRHPLRQTPPYRHTPPGRHPPHPPPPVNGHCIGRYASYWNAFLFNGNIKTIADQFMLSPSAIFAIC